MLLAYIEKVKTINLGWREYIFCDAKSDPGTTDIPPPETAVLDHASTTYVRSTSYASDQRRQPTNSCISAPMIPVRLIKLAHHPRINKTTSRGNLLNLLRFLLLYFKLLDHSIAWQRLPIDRKERRPAGRETESPTSGCGTSTIERARSYCSTYIPLSIWTLINFQFSMHAERAITPWKHIFFILVYSCVRRFRVDFFGVSFWRWIACRPRVVVLLVLFVCL
jgi:hypothetical protein